MNSPAPLYSYSFAANLNWSSLNPSGKEILEYLCRVCETYHLDENIQFNTKVTELRWSEKNKEWETRIAEDKPDGRLHESTIRSRVAISAVGKFNEPKTSVLEHIPGIHTFKGRILHTARWDESVSLEGRNILVIGSGCSAAQLVPEVLRDSMKAKSVTQIMRSPPWVAPRALSEEGILAEKYILCVLRHVPGLARIVRLIMLAVLETDYFRFYKASAVCRLFRSMKKKSLLEYMRRTVPDQYHGALTPHYEMGCKRLVQDSGWFQSLRDSKINLTTSKIKRVEPYAVVLGCKKDDENEDSRVATDIIILATGYETTNLLESISVFGRNGVELQDAWAQRGGPHAYLGVSMDKFPNLFFVFGPNSSVGHTTVLIGIENSISYIVSLIKHIVNGQVRALEVKEEACRRWTSEIQAASRSSVWMKGGCQNWYIDGGRWNSMIYPFSQ
ncbi:hypothetical protein BDV12DRAFT_163269 [Aspergillus spectabilis]